jgi:hypothetical protein
MSNIAVACAPGAFLRALHALHGESRRYPFYLSCPNLAFSNILFMENEPNFEIDQMNITKAPTTNYRNSHLQKCPKKRTQNEPKRTQFIIQKAKAM